MSNIVEWKDAIIDICMDGSLNESQFIKHMNKCVKQMTDTRTPSESGGQFPLDALMNPNEPLRFLKDKEPPSEVCACGSKYQYQAGTKLFCSVCGKEVSK